MQWSTATKMNVESNKPGKLMNSCVSHFLTHKLLFAIFYASDFHCCQFPSFMMVSHQINYMECQPFKWIIGR